MKSTVEDALKRVFNPEFLNRIDDVIVFQPLQKEHIFQIIDVMGRELFKRVEDLGISIEWDDKAKEFLVEKGYDPQFGARPLRRALQKFVEDPMAESILNNNLGEGATLKIVYNAEEKADGLIFISQMPPEPEPLPTKNKRSKKSEEATDEEASKTLEE
jgi:ATP-dependent Clp protease ATP-binding subunit ClpC